MRGLVSEHIPDVYSPNNIHSFTWLWASVTIIQAIIFIFALKYHQVSENIYILTLLSYLLGNLYLVPKLIENNQLNRTEIRISVALAVVNWLLMAHSLADLWGAYYGTEKVLLIGFFSLVMCLNTSAMLLCVATTPIIIAHGIYEGYFLGVSGLGLWTSVIKYPLFLVAIVITQINTNKRLMESHQRLLLLNKQLIDLKNLDPLTGLNNRRVFDNEMSYLVNLHRRNQQPLSLMIIDIDFFKRYNDAMGHPEGDRCLKSVTKAIQHAVKRDTDIIARIGGEEFAVILPNTTLEACQHVAQSAIESVRRSQILHPDSPVSDVVTISIGCACTSKQIETSEALYREADDALYHIKKTTRNSYWPQ